MKNQKQDSKDVSDSEYEAIIRRWEASEPANCVNADPSGCYTEPCTRYDLNPRDCMEDPCCCCC
ncbi:MAG: hypothetical protein JSW04_04645 [Desulfobacterales bacterium]|nr:MAG: hypothetical protein JSW04_04645 [Desulfobacterales bacterium]